MGNRKLKGFLVTVVAMVLFAETALIFGGVTFSGDNVVTICSLFALTGGAFFGANVGEHFAEAKKTNA